MAVLLVFMLANRQLTLQTLRLLISILQGFILQLTQIFTKLLLLGQHFLLHFFNLIFEFIFSILQKVFLSWTRDLLLLYFQQLLPSIFYYRASALLTVRSLTHRVTFILFYYCQWPIHVIRRLYFSQYRG
jgi:hypothetical protein